MEEAERIDRTAYDPFIFLERGGRGELLLSDHRMVEKCPIFEELEGWLGNGADWESVARTVVAEQLPQLRDTVSFDSEAGMFVALGPRAALQSLATILHATFHDESKLRDFLSRSELD
jgi:hypothetical protein